MSDISSPPSSTVTLPLQTTAELLANFPASADYLGYYARVSDLYGSLDEILRCRYDGFNYRWVPQRENFNHIVTTAGNINLVSLVTAPTVRTAGGLTGAITFTPSSANAYIGQRYRIIVSGTLGLYTASITNLIGSNVTLLGNTAKDIEYTSAGWSSISS